MRFPTLILISLSLVCASSSFAQSPANEKYRVVFGDKATMSSFVDQLNKSGEERYRLKTSTFAYQELSGMTYYLPVGILQSDETQFEYASFEVINNFFFAITGFKRKYAEQSKHGFRIVNHFLTDAICDEQSSEDVIQTIPICKTTYQFLVEREKGRNAPTDFLMAEDTPTFKRDPSRNLGSAIMDKWAEGFYPARVLSNYQIVLAQRDARTDLEPEPLEIQVLNSTFMNHVKKKIRKLGQQGFRLAVIGQECAVM